MRSLRILAVVPALAICTSNPCLVRAATPAPTGSAIPSPSPVASGNAGLAQFDTEALAQTHCPADKVVWLNLRNNVYFEKDSVYWGKTRRGAYVCRKEADAAGDHETTAMPMNKPQF